MCHNHRLFGLLKLVSEPNHWLIELHSAMILVLVLTRLGLSVSSLKIANLYSVLSCHESSHVLCYCKLCVEISSVWTDPVAVDLRW